MVFLRLIPILLSIGAPSASAMHALAPPAPASSAAASAIEVIEADTAPDSTDAAADDTRDESESSSDSHSSECPGHPDLAGDDGPLLTMAGGAFAPRALPGLVPHELPTGPLDGVPLTLLRPPAR